jgi:hypothetical protein
MTREEARAVLKESGGRMFQSLDADQLGGCLPIAGACFGERECAVAVPAGTVLTAEVMQAAGILVSGWLMATRA